MNNIFSDHAVSQIGLIRVKYFLKTSVRKVSVRSDECLAILETK